MHICDERSTTVVVQCKFMVSHILDQCPLADAHIGYMDMQELVSAVLCCAVLCCAVLCCAVLCCALYCQQTMDACTFGAQNSICRSHVAPPSPAHCPFIGPLKCSQTKLAEIAVTNAAMHFAAALTLQARHGSHTAGQGPGLPSM